jgi:hypothetical protein
MIADATNHVVNYWCADMVTIRFARELLERLKAQVGLEPTRPTKCLGDWYAKLVSTKRGMLVVCVSGRSLLPALVEEATDSGVSVHAFRKAVPLNDRWVGISLVRSICLATWSNSAASRCPATPNSRVSESFSPLRQMRYIHTHHVKPASRQAGRSLLERRGQN